MRFFRLSLLLGICYWGACLSPATDVVIDAGKKYQTIEGFGTCLVAWQQGFRELYRTEAFPETYVDTMGCTMLRVNMWGPTYPDRQEDWTKIRSEDFQMQANGGRPQIFVDFGQAILKRNPEIKIIGTVWSPPAWMKENGSIKAQKSSAIRAGGYGENQNRVKQEYFPHFCQWMVEYVRKHDQAGVPFYAVSPGNEVQFSQSFESCVWDADDYVKILPMLRKHLDDAGYADVKIFGPETMTSHMYPGGTGSYVQAIKDDSAALQAIGAFATHGYEDGVVGEMSANSSRVFWEQVADTGKPFWITEGGTGEHDWPAPIRKGVANALHNALVAGNCSAFVPWQITDRQANEHGLMRMDELTPKSHAARHYFKFIRPGAVRIDAQPGFAEVQVGAFVHEADRQLTVVAINATDAEQPLKLTLKNLATGSTMNAVRTSADEQFQTIDPVPVEGSTASVRLPPRSLVTFTAEIRPDAD
ncbi:hypothetical protein FYK55_15730 [Roseiconus nitratireducens]|uniref:Uncharacterized protein n=1 Tax=Roseiconus nitratireducens TaxID=2605748 RepID=A0A5M6D6U2_9BACT|nr:glycoside hydrolase family 30 beta sandwich domain-containing protein [Roseiconus nitratireducens]KAA5542250.1 hypothetical protein FYK55_15730 [Roseiconus nitratireducens]